MDHFLSSTFLVVTMVPALAMPITNGTRTKGGFILENPFVEEPRGRGTMGLFWSCVVTLVLCIWTGVHPNIMAGSKSSSRLAYRIFWTLCAAILPEFIILCAFGQWYKAKNIRDAWDRQFPEKKKSIGLEGGFFVLMGGITVGELGEDGEYKVTLTPRGFTECLKSPDLCKKLGELTRESITDKGKAGHLTKLLALVQASWFIFQCILRKVHGLPITLLEVHVAIQVVFTWISYFFWWFKPLDINEPIKLNIDHKMIGTTTTTATPSITTEPTTPTTPTTPNTLTPSHIPATITISTIPTGGKGGASEMIEKIPESIENNKLMMKDASGKKNPGYTVVIEKNRPGGLNIFLRCVYDVLEYIVGEESGLMPMWVVGLLIISNGALHLLAWNVHFATPAEQMLWRMSCALISVGAIIYIPIVAKTDFEDYLLEAVWDLRFLDEKVFRSTMRRYKEDYQKIVGGWLRAVFVFSWLMTLTYAFCILFITVESFIGLRSVPKGAYDTPDWDGDKYWPHLG